MSKIVLIIIALFFPPVAVFFKRGITADFWINIILCLIMFFPGMVHALYLVAQD